MADKELAMATLLRHPALRDRNRKITLDELVKRQRKKKRPPLAIERDGNQRGLSLRKFDAEAEVHRVLFTVLKFKGDLQTIRAETVIRPVEIARDPAEGGQIVEHLGGLLDVFPLDESLRADDQRPFARS